MTTLGTRLRTLRQQAGLSQGELAKGLVSKSMISQIESDKARPSRELLTALAERVGVTIDQLLPVKYDDQERLARYKQAQAFLSLGHDHDALPLLQSCLRDPHPNWSKLELTRQTAACLHRIGAFAEARSLCEEALRLAIRENKPDDAISVRFLLGQVADAEEDPHVALHEWLRVYQEMNGPEKRWAETGKFPRLTELCLHLAKLHAKLDRYEEAVHFYQESKRAWESHPPSTYIQVETECGLGAMYAKLKRFSEAEGHLLQAEAFCERLRDRKRLYEVKAQRVTLLRQAGRAQEAKGLLEECLKVVSCRQLREQKAWLLREKAIIYRQTGKEDKALALLQEALDLGPGTARFTGNIRLARAEIYWSRGDQETAMQEAEAAKALLVLEPHVEELLRVFRLLTKMYKQVGDYKRASEGVIAMNDLLNKQMRNRGWVL